MTEAVLVSNGPGELYTWVLPVLRELRRRCPEVKITISLVPCQFASGSEARIAHGFGADGVTTPQEFIHYMTTGKRPAPFGGDHGFVVSLGGNVDFAARLGRKLGYPLFRYGFVPVRHRSIRRLFVPDESARRRALRLGIDRDRVLAIGNLVADSVEASAPAPGGGSPTLLLFPGSRGRITLLLIPFFIAIADRLGQRFPEAAFVWPVSRLLDEKTIADGISARGPAVPGMAAGRREGDLVFTPNGTRIRLIPEADRYGFMRSADLAITIPGTNTLELGIAGLPGLVLLPLYRPDLIPLEGPLEILGMIPLLGRHLKGSLVRLGVRFLREPLSLPNRISGEPLMEELRGRLTPEEIAGRAAALLEDRPELTRRRTRLLATMPRPGAARQLVGSILDDLGGDMQGAP